MSCIGMLEYLRLVPVSTAVYSHWFMLKAGNAENTSPLYSKNSQESAKSQRGLIIITFLNYISYQLSAIIVLLKNQCGILAG